MSSFKPSGGQGSSQSPAPLHTHSAVPSAVAAHSASISLPASLASVGGKILLTFEEAGILLGISERKAHEVVSDLVTPVVLGPRCVRVVRSELEAAVAGLPRRAAPTEPFQLLRGRVEKLKRDATTAATGV